MQQADGMSSTATANAFQGRGAPCSDTRPPGPPLTPRLPRPLGLTSGPTPGPTDVHLAAPGLALHKHRHREPRGWGLKGMWRPRTREPWELLLRGALPAATRAATSLGGLCQHSHMAATFPRHRVCEEGASGPCRDASALAGYGFGGSVVWQNVVTSLKDQGPLLHGLLLSTSHGQASAGDALSLATPGQTVPALGPRYDQGSPTRGGL